MNKEREVYDPLRAKTKIALFVAVSFLCGMGLASQFGFTDARPAGPYVETGPQVPASAVQPALDLSNAFVNIADAVTPSVVRIEVRRRQLRNDRGIQEFFFPREPRGQPDVVTVEGSGFITSEDGYVMTNNHVVEDAEAITVAVRDGRTFPAEVVGTDPTTDVAVIKIDGSNFPAASLGSSAEVRVGEWVLAIGNPGFSRGSSLDYSVTAGIVSARGRNLSLIANELEQDPRFTGNLPGFAIEDFIQTDAVINRGNSGGPMVNLRGQVIGINTAIASATGFYQGYGFAIPIDLAHRVMEDLVAYGRVRRAYLGVRMRSVTPEDAEVYELPEIAGALVQEVTEDTPAEEAGIQAVDVITAVDGEAIHTSNDLQHNIALRAPGDQVRVTVYRDGKPMDIQVRLEEAPFSDQLAEAPTPRARTADKIGIQVADVTPEIASRLNLETTEGAVVQSVQPGGPAARRNLGLNCVIREINRQAIRDADDVEAAFREVEAGEVVSLIAQCPRRDGSTSDRNVYNIRVPR